MGSLEPMSRTQVALEEELGACIPTVFKGNIVYFFCNAASGNYDHWDKWDKLGWVRINWISRIRLGPPWDLS
jgi:hypothetical protein